MGRKYRFVAIEGEGDHFEPLLHFFELEPDPTRPTRVLGPNDHPIPYDNMLWTRYERGTLFDFRFLGFKFSYDSLAVVVAELARATRSRIMCIEELSTVINDLIILVSPEGELIRRIFHSEFEECVSEGSPLFDAGQPRYEDPAEGFDYPERMPEYALEWFVGFDAYEWSNLRFDARSPSQMIATPVRDT
jgi:hypothetical protein